MWKIVTLTSAVAVVLYWATLFRPTVLSVSTRFLPLGTAYMMWTGIGAFGAFTLGVLVPG